MEPVKQPTVRGRHALRSLSLAEVERASKYHVYEYSRDQLDNAAALLADWLETTARHGIRPDTLTGSGLADVALLAARKQGGKQ